MRTVVFDLDGTLADTSGDLIAAANACFDTMGAKVQLDPARDAGTAVKGARAMLRLGLTRLGQGAGAATEAEIDRWYPALVDHYGRNIDTHTTLYDGAIEAVSRIRDAGDRVSICTNKPEALAEALLQRLGVRAMFDALIGADTLPVRKPDPAPLRAAIQQAGGDVHRACLIGDTATDRDCARNLGIPAVLVTFGPDGHGVVDLAPAATLHHFDDLPALVVGLLPLGGRM